MIDRTQYGDFNRFLVSIGIIFIAIGILLPYMYMKESFDLLIKNEDITALTPIAQDVIKTRQSFAQKLVNFIPFVSGVSIIIGLAISGIGLAKWKNRQNIEDNKLKGDLDKVKAETEKTKTEQLKLKKDIEKMSKAEVEQIRKKEIEKNEPSLNATEKKLSLTNYVLIESMIADKFKYEYSDKYNVFSNYKINNQEFDIILERISSKTNSINLGKDVLVEIKYVGEINKRLVKDTFMQTGAMLKAYPNAITNPIILFIYRDSKGKLNRENLLSSIIEEWSDKTVKKWAVRFINVKDLPALKLKDILNI